MNACECRFCSFSNITCSALTAHHKTRSPPPPALQYGWKMPTLMPFSDDVCNLFFRLSNHCLRKRKESTATNASDNNNQRLRTTRVSISGGKRVTILTETETETLSAVLQRCIIITRKLTILHYLELGMAVRYQLHQ